MIYLKYQRTIHTISNFYTVSQSVSIVHNQYENWHRIIFIKIVQNRTKSTKIQYLQLQRTVLINLLTKIQLTTLLNNHMSLPDLEKPSYDCK